MENIDKKTCLLILGSLFFILLPGINHGIWRPDEPYMAGICSEMARTADFAVPKLNGIPFLEKPPLYYWIAAAFGMVLGSADDVPFRLASTLFSILTLLTVFFGIRKRTSDLTAVMACLVLSTLWQFFDQSRWIIVDISLVFGVALSMIAWFRITHEGKWTDSMLLGIGTAIAFMAKGFVGPAMIVSAIVVDIVRKPDFRLIIKSKPHIAFIFFMLPIGFWIAELFSYGGWPFVREVIVVNNIMRFTGAPEGAALGHMHGPFYYLPKIPSEMIPWTLIGIPAFFASFKKFRDDSYLPWFIGPLVLLSMSSAKRGLYLAPLGPAIACMIATWLSSPPKFKWEGIIIIIMWGLVAAGSLASFAGVFLGFPVWGMLMGIISVGSVIYIYKYSGLMMSNLALCISICIVMASTMFVFYIYQQPKEDYLPFAKKALAVSDGKEITLLADDEVFEGVMPMITGKYFKNVPKPESITNEGYYIWADSRKDDTLRKVRKLYKVDVVLDKRIGRKNARLAYIIPEPHAKLGR
jgi:4-amino-4-deoxy-L-arabinose transferase-like glycosyltransferase